jgi:hypothetical protein
MQKTLVKLLACAALLLVGGGLLFYSGSRYIREHHELNTAAARYDAIATAAHNGAFDYANTHVDTLIMDAEARAADNSKWEQVRVAALELKCLLPYARAEKLHRQYGEVSSGRSSAGLPKLEDMFMAYKEFERACSDLIGKDGFVDPEIAYRLEDYVANALFWQVILKQGMSPDAKLADLKPFYDPMLEHYIQARDWAEQVCKLTGNCTYKTKTAQDLDFVTRVPKELMDEQEKKQQQSKEQQSQKPSEQGLGDLLEKAQQGKQDKGEGEGLGSILAKPNKDQKGDLLPGPLGGPYGAGKSRGPGIGIK